MKAFSGRHYARNAGRAGELQPCVICGIGIEQPTHHVRVNVFNEILQVGADVTPNEDLGWFPIGPNCRRWLQRNEPKVLLLSAS